MADLIVSLALIQDCGRLVGGATPASDPESAARTVETFWKSHGYRVTVSYRAVLGYEVDGENTQHSAISFGANDIAMTLLGGSDCVPGNVHDG